MTQWTGPGSSGSPTPAPLQDATNTVSAELVERNKEIQRLQAVLRGFMTKKGSKRGAPTNDGDDEDATASKKSKNDEVDVTDNHEAGRIIGRFLGPFVDIAEVVTHGISVDAALEGDEVEDKPLLLEAWKILWGHFPHMHEDLLEMSDTPMVLRTAVKQMTRGAEAARQHDTGTLKTRILGWLYKDPLTPLTPPLADLQNKTLRGMAHPVFARLLTPIEWEATAETYTQIIEGVKRLTGVQLPRFLFPLDLEFPVDTDFSDPAWLVIFDKACTGELLLRAAKAIYMGPDAALKGDGYHKGRASNAKIIRLTTFTPRLIAGVATQVYFALSSQPEWNKRDGDFDYDQFFWTVWELFEVDEDWTKDIIELWNKVVLGTTPKPDEAPIDDGPSAFEQLKAAKAAAAAAATATAAQPPPVTQQAAAVTEQAGTATGAASGSTPAPAATVVTP